MGVFKDKDIQTDVFTLWFITTLIIYSFSFNFSLHATSF